ncbi:hypothetical protein QAD02_018225 [Eretmocerus hayati]|uniref:Uncharacterized protein n=1 Tax=Eretmocerus hayati TaxID=131215 RepID=A0ACC2PG40_9HYME|nr:hypothetical protein QAD02_018225 [Eretmocerus hayati]
MIENNQVIFKKQTFPHANGTMFKPGLVTRVNESTAQIVNVTLRFERGNSLTIAADGKVAKYTNIVPLIKNQLGVSKVDVIPLVIGSTGDLAKMVWKQPKESWTEKRRFHDYGHDSGRFLNWNNASFLDYG